MQKIKGVASDFSTSLFQIAEIITQKINKVKCF